ncbi:MAG: phosphoribosylglycinamide formyltransferase-1 [Flavobacteriales bacterium]|jgi:phosphoribosylglycinamide formyltransferase-1
MKRIAIFASGSGSNTEVICKHFQDSQNIEVGLVLSNKPNSKVIDRTKRLLIPSFVFNSEQLIDGTVLNKLKQQRIDFIVLAGFLKRIPSDIIDAFEDRIINIHPALLPDYGGEGMYGMNVHNAVHENEEEETGITIHYVNNEYDEGDIIFQESIELAPEDEPLDICGMIQELEHRHYPGIIESLMMELD